MPSPQTSYLPSYQYCEHMCSFVMQSKSLVLFMCVCRRVRKEETRNAVLETVAMTAGTLRGVSLSLHHDTLETTPWTGERHLSTHTRHMYNLKCVNVIKYHSCDIYYFRKKT